MAGSWVRPAGPALGDSVVSWLEGVAVAVWGRDCAVPARAGDGTAAWVGGAVFGSGAPPVLRLAVHFPVVSPVRFGIRRSGAGGVVMRCPCTLVRVSRSAFGFGGSVVLLVVVNFPLGRRGMWYLATVACFATSFLVCFWLF